ncbi:MAG TPA: VOC family protein [Actinomycetota bacterium]|nr:VOC family protein [Actinomycetota bacterium]
MSPDTAAYEAALDKVVDSMHAEFGQDLLGLLLAGSFAYGTPAATSDLDVFVITKQPWRQKRLTVVDDVEVELFVNPPHKIREEFGRGRISSTVDMFSRGRVLFDADGVMSELVSEAQSVRRVPPAQPHGDRIFRLRYFITDLLKDAQDVVEAGDDAGAEIVMAHCLYEALTVRYERAGRRMPKHKYVMQDLSEWEPALARRAGELLVSEAPIRNRFRALGVIVDEVLAPIGGRLVSGETEREPAPEPQGPSRLDSVVIDCAHPASLARFWAAALGYTVAPYDDEEIERLRAMGVEDVEDDPGVLLLPPGDGPRVFCVKVPEPKEGKNRVHIDVKVDGAQDVDRLVSLGARVLEPPGGDRDWTVMADPEGNEFCALPSSGA